MSDLSNAIKQICDEKGLAYEAVLATIESALAAAYRKDFGKKNQNIVVQFDPETGKSKVYDIKTVVEDLPEEEIPEDEEAEEEETTGKQPVIKKEKKEEADSVPGDKVKEGDKVKGKKPAETGDGEKPEDGESSSAEAAEGEEEHKFNPKTEMQISDARMVKKTAKIGEELKMKLEVPAEYGRMAAQTAKQVIIQRLREAEREMIFSDFKDKEKEVVCGRSPAPGRQDRTGRSGQSGRHPDAGREITGEEYRPGDRVKVYVREVNSKPKGPEIILSRTSEEILKKIFYLEIPEISNGLIELKNVAREAGYRSKVAVWTDSDNVDPIGSCVGQRGARIQTIISELGGEKVDIIQYDDDPTRYISNALSPAKIIEIALDEKEKKAKVKVATEQLSLAIGKGGQNARLAAKLTGWRIDIVEYKKEKTEDEKGKEGEAAEKAEKKEESGEENKKNSDKITDNSKQITEKKEEQNGDENNKNEKEKEDKKIDKEDKKMKEKDKENKKGKSDDKKEINEKKDKAKDKTDKKEKKEKKSEKKGE